MLNKKISFNDCIYCSESPHQQKPSIFVKSLRHHPVSRLSQLRQSLHEASLHFIEKFKTLKSTLDPQLENLESENVKDSHDNFDQSSFENLQTGSRLSCLKKGDTVLQDAIKRIDISGPSLSHREGIHFDTDVQNISAYSNLRHTVSRCLTLSTQLKNQLEQISENTFDTAYFAETESAETIKPGNQKRPYNFYIGGILSRPKNPLIVFSRKFSARRQLEF